MYKIQLHEDLKTESLPAAKSKKLQQPKNLT